MTSRRKNPLALTEDEVQFLRSDRSAQSVRGFVSRQHESVGVRTSAYRKVAAAARAERDAIVEVAMLNVVRAASSHSSTAEARLPEVESELRRLESELADTRRKLGIATAAPALAVHSDGTGR